MITASDSPQLRTILALRRLGSALSMSNRAVGSALGIKDADLAVLDVLHREGPLTPTELARNNPLTNIDVSNPPIISLIIKIA